MIPGWFPSVILKKFDNCITENGDSSYVNLTTGSSGSTPTSIYRSDIVNEFEKAISGTSIRVF